MSTIQIEELRSNLASALQRVRGGAHLLIADNGTLVAELKPVQPPPEPGLRPFGLARGEFSVPDDFDAPLPEEMMQEFEGK
jgi:antitoxin (DNA-binding transcriptional repressor) of toxin-antitoxin stability system